MRTPDDAAGDGPHEGEAPVERPLLEDDQAERGDDAPAFVCGVPCPSPACTNGKCAL